jgi:hypothetical protein
MLLEWCCFPKTWWQVWESVKRWFGAALAGQKCPQIEEVLVNNPSYLSRILPFFPTIKAQDRHPQTETHPR